MISPALLEIICCPESQQRLEWAQPALLAQLNLQIAAGQLKNRANQRVEAPLESGLVRADHKLLYPIRQHIPVLLIAEAIPLPALSQNES
jgi:uncharacterized protein